VTVYCPIHSGEDPFQPCWDGCIVQRWEGRQARRALAKLWTDRQAGVTPRYVYLRARKKIHA